MVEWPSESPWVIEAVVLMWRSLGCEVWADAVENLRDAESLRGFGVDYVQGYAHGAPQSRDKMLAQIAAAAK